MKTSKYTARILLVAFLVIFFIFSCAKDEELQNIESLYETAQASTGEEKIQATLDYLLAIVLYQESVVAKNPKNLNIELLDTALEFAEGIAISDENTMQNKLLYINQATLFLMKAAYYDKKGDVVQAVSNVDGGFQIFEMLMETYPDDIIVRGYRAMSYSELPDLFGKADAVDSDFMFAYDYVRSNDMKAIDEYTSSMLPYIVNAAIAYYSEHDASDKATMFTELLSILQ